MDAQEVRALPEQLPKNWDWPEGYEVHLHPAEKKGYSGVATLSRIPMQIVRTGKPSAIDPEDSEGRIVVSKHNQITCINTYLPSGSSGDERQRFKETWMDEWRNFLQPYIDSSEPVIVCEILNVAHTEDDIWNPKGNAKMSGFLPPNVSGLANYWMTVGMMHSRTNMVVAKSTVGGQTGDTGKEAGG